MNKNVLVLPLGPITLSRAMKLQLGIEFSHSRQGELN